MDSSAEPDTSGSIGLCNISRRIRLIYGPPYSMDIVSSPDGGTSVYPVSYTHLYWNKSGPNSFWDCALFFLP